MNISPDERWLMFLQNATTMRAYIRRRVACHAEADEVFQDLSLTVIYHRLGPRDARFFVAWCHALARHLVAHHFRKKRRNANMFVRFELELGKANRNIQMDPERHAAAREELRRLDSHLDATSLELLSQRYLLERNAEEIGVSLDQSAAAVRMRLMRLRFAAKRSLSSPERRQRRS